MLQHPKTDSKTIFVLTHTHTQLQDMEAYIRANLRAATFSEWGKNEILWVI
jgi:hypothetical protein